MAFDLGAAIAKRKLGKTGEKRPIKGSNLDKLVTPDWWLFFQSIYKAHQCVFLQSSLWKIASLMPWIPSFQDGHTKITHFYARDYFRNILFDHVKRGSISHSQLFAPYCSFFRKNPIHLSAKIQEPKWSRRIEPIHDFIAPFDIIRFFWVNSLSQYMFFSENRIFVLLNLNTPWLPTNIIASEWNVYNIAYEGDV